ncbi:hypothetical protein QC763_108150 [Podospora pseudopauciseta]|uniref:Zn(2)-C6 fungal-type domain-containing protein n=1 Tax=Podospora pseudopauciseta TaxID=2093780 RepID=A0ABR0HY41_9PEZI|nr:hypothetical protein QC763_108150 [Podospora pseudopauciseta]
MSSLMLDRSRIRGAGGFPWGEPAAAPRSQGLDRDSASTSSQSDDFSDLFDWTAYERHGTSDVTTQSQHSAEGAKGVPAFPRSPQSSPQSPGPASDLDGDLPMPDVESDPHVLVWPVLGPEPTREMSPIELRPPHLGQPDMAAPRAVQNERPQSKRPRVLESPEQTKEVRDAGACYHCRMNKSKCSPTSACEPCLKHPKPELACVRQLLSSMVASQSARWNLSEPPRREPMNEGGSFVIFVSFSDKTNSRCLPLTVAPFIHPDQGTRFGISSSSQPLQENALLAWAQDDMQMDDRIDDFESLLNHFHIHHVCGEGLKRAMDRATAGKSIKAVESQKKLLSNLLELKLMWKIWSCKDFFGRRQEAGAGRPLGLQFSSVQSWLRFTAASAISRLEKNILEVFDEYLKKDAAGLTTATKPILELSRWVSLWQMILVYRRSLRLLQEHNEAEPYVPGVETNEKRRRFRTTTADLFRSVVVIYWELFHKPKTIQNIQNPEARLFGDDALHRGFQSVVAAVPTFYQQVANLSLPADEFFRAHLVDRDLKKPKTKRR